MYQVAKDFVIPLIAPAVAIVVPTLVFFILPRRRDRQKAVLELFTAFTAEEMRQARLAGWAYFVTEVNGDPEEQRRRFDQYLAYLTDQAVGTVEPERMEVYQKTSRVLDFFVLVEGYIRQRLVNEELVRSYLSHFYLYWRENLMNPMRKRRQLVESCDPRRVPLWWKPLVNLDRRICVPG